MHQFCTLAGYGAEAINPYLAFETLEDMIPSLDEKISRDEVVKRYIKAIDKGILKVMSKMGISTYQSYCGAQIFDAVGLSSDFVDALFYRHRDPDRGRRPASRSPQEPSSATSDAFGENPVYRDALDVGGEYALRIARRSACLDPADGIDVAARGARQFARQVLARSPSRVNEQSEELLTHPRPVPH